MVNMNGVETQAVALNWMLTVPEAETGEVAVGEAVPEYLMPIEPTAATGDKAVGEAEPEN